MSLNKQFPHVLKSDNVPCLCEESAWIKFFIASENSIIRDMGETLASMTGNSLGEESQSLPLERKSPRDWEQAMLVAECLKFSENDYLVELSRILFEWFSVTFQFDFCD